MATVGRRRAPPRAAARRRAPGPAPGFKLLLTDVGVFGWQRRKARVEQRPLTMKISGSGPIHPTPTRPGRAARANKRSSFASAMSGDPAPASNVTSAAPIGPVDGILAVQEGSHRHRRAVARHQARPRSARPPRRHPLRPVDGVDPARAPASAARRGGDTAARGQRPAPWGHSRRNRSQGIGRAGEARHHLTMRPAGPAPARPHTVGLAEHPQRPYIPRRS